MHRTTTYRVWWYQILYNTIWPPDDEQNCAQNMYRNIINLLHQILLLLVEHWASMTSFHALRSPVIPLTSFHDLLVLLISSSTVLRHVLFGLPLLLYPWGFQSNAVFSIAPVSLRNVCPIQFNFLLFIWFSTDFPEDSNLMQFSLLLLFLYVMCVQSNSIFFFLSDFLLTFDGWSSIVLCS